MTIICSLKCAINESGNLMIPNKFSFRNAKKIYYTVNENTRNERDWLSLYSADIFLLHNCASVSSGLFVIPCRIRSLTVPETLANNAKRE